MTNKPIPGGVTRCKCPAPDAQGVLPVLAAGSGLVMPAQV